MEARGTSLINFSLSLVPQLVPSTGAVGVRQTGGMSMSAAVDVGCSVSVIDILSLKLFVER